MRRVLPRGRDGCRVHHRLKARVADQGTCLPRISQVSVHIGRGEGAGQVGGDDTMPGQAQLRHHGAPDHARGTGHQHIHIPATTIPFPPAGFAGVHR